MASPSQKSQQKQQAAGNSDSNVWYFEQFRKNAEQWKESLGNNSAFSDWQETQSQAANRFQKAVDSTMRSASNLWEQSSEYYSAIIERCNQAVSQTVEQASNANSLISESTSEAARIASKSLACRTPEDCRNWAQDCMNSAAQFAQQCLVTSAQGAVDAQSTVAKPLAQQALSLQEAALRTWCELNPLAQWCKVTS